jgi:PKD repeat protein
VSAFAIASNGSLGAVGSPVAAGTKPTGSAVSPDGRFVYVHDFFGPPSTFAFARGTDGALSPVAGSPYDSGGGGGDFESLAISPNQGPKANLKVIPKSPGIKEKTQFKGDASTDSDGSVVSYVYDFGDGETKTATAEKPKVGHKYKKAGTYTATLTVTDNEGCSASVVYTGQTASCNGDTSAVATKTVTVADKAVDKPKIKARSKQKQSGKKIVVTVKAGAKEKVNVVGTGSVKIKGKGKQLALAKVKKSVKANGQKTLKLKLKKEQANFKVFRALDDKKPVKAKIQIKMTDAAGNEVKPKLAVQLKK